MQPLSKACYSAVIDNMTSPLNYGVNGGRIGEISMGKNYRWVVPAPAWELPPPGPYPVANLVDNLAEMSQALAQAEERLAVYAGTV